MGANLEQAENDGWTCLMFAAHNGYFELLNYLVAKGVNVNARNVKGMNAEDLAQLGVDMGVMSETMAAPIKAILWRRGSTSNIEKQQEEDATSQHSGGQDGSKKKTGFFSW